MELIQKMNTIEPIYSLLLSLLVVLIFMFIVFIILTIYDKYFCKPDHSNNHYPTDNDYFGL